MWGEQPVKLIQERMASPASQALCPGPSAGPRKPQRSSPPNSSPNPGSAKGSHGVSTRRPVWEERARIAVGTGARGSRIG